MVVKLIDGKRVDVEEYLAKYPPDIQRIAQKIREIVLSNYPFLDEVIKYCTPIYLKDRNICSINSYDDHVNLMIWKADELDDKYNVLEGNNEKLKYVKIDKLEDIKSDTIKNLLNQAIEIE